MARSILAMLLLVACVPQPQPVELKWSPAPGVQCPDPTRNFLCYRSEPLPREVLYQTHFPNRRVLCRVNVETCCGYCDGQ